LTTNQSVYQPGQPIQMTFTETNTSNQPVTVGEGPSIDGFDVTQSGKPVWESNAGVNPLFILVKTLQPGQSLTLHSTWNGVPSPAQPPIPSSGTFTVTNQLDPQGASATFQIEPSLSYSLTTDRSAYQAGEPIAITLTETNTTSQAVTATVDPTDFTVTANGGVVWQCNPDNASLPGTPATLQPGQSVTQTATWDGTQSFEGTNINLWGSYVVSNPNAPGMTAAFQINDPLAPSISTNQPVYQVGQPVKITSHQTNTSDQPITIVTGHGPGGGVEVSQNGTVVWMSVPADVPQPQSISLGTQTLQPGQALTSTSTWDGVPSSAGPTASPVTGSFVASLAGNSQAPTASFQVTPVSSGPTPPAQNPQPVTQTLATNLQTSQGGHTVVMTLTLKNVSSQSVAITPNPSSDGFSVLSGTTKLWHSARSKRTVKVRTLSAGQSITFRMVWNGMPNQRGVKKLPGGSYTVEASEGGYSAGATIQIDRQE